MQFLHLYSSNMRNIYAELVCDPGCVDHNSIFVRKFTIKHLHHNPSPSTVCLAAHRRPVPRGGSRPRQASVLLGLDLVLPNWSLCDGPLVYGSVVALRVGDARQGVNQ